MFSNQNEANAIPSNKIEEAIEENNGIVDKSMQIIMDHSRESRQQKRSRMRQINQIEMLSYQGISFNKFIPVVEKVSNPYTLLVTIFSIADHFEWRNYLCHLQILIKKFSNFVESSRGKILEELTCISSREQILCGYDFQQRLETMLHLSNKEFQSHLLILVHALIAYNKRYCILNEAKLSDHLIYKHSYQKCIRQEVLWLLTRMSVSCQAIYKVIRSYLTNQQVTPLLPVLTITANFIYEQPDHIIQNFITCEEFQAIIEKGLLSPHFQTNRETVFICNNLLFKNKICANFIISNQNLITQISKLNNEEVNIFNIAINSNKQLNSMEDEQTR